LAKNKMPDHVHPDWLQPSWPPEFVARGVRSLITTRAGGESVGPYASFNLRSNADEAASVTEANQARLRSCVPADPIWLKQVHGTAVLDADTWLAARAAAQSTSDAATSIPTSPATPPSTLPIADASVAAQAGIVLAVQTADCLPLLFADAMHGVLGAAHAGWRGLAAGVVEATVSAMLAKGAHARDIQVYLGPAISQAAFEVGEDVLRAFTDHDPRAESAFKPHPAAHGKWFADLYALARQRLGAMGITRIAGGEHCTFTDPARFYSYRKSNSTGRMASLIWR
jgi:polyphenol oxidase